VEALIVASGCVVLVGIGFMIRFCVADAKYRGRSPLLLTLLAVFCFPWGLIGWLLFRPEPPIDAEDQRSFRLENYRVQ
jgi:hypothetical protein